MHKSTLFLGVYILTFLFPRITAASDVPPDINFELGSRVQFMYLNTNSEAIAAREQSDFLVRRARLRLKGDIDGWIKLALQSEYSEQPSASAADGKIIDAYINLAPKKELQVFLGQHMSPALRQNLTHINALMAIDRPAMASKSLSWGTKAKTRFSTLTMDNTDGGLDGNANVRDIGATVFGVLSLSDALHYKYYFGLYEGAQSANTDRFTSRLQINFGDSEDAYFNASTYYGKRSTFALGFSIDRQSQVARDFETGEQVDYKLASIDAFFEQQFSFAAISAELGVIDLDLGGANQLSDQLLTQTLSKVSALAAEGEGMYFQGALTKGAWQPWFLWERWQSNDSNDVGNYSNVRVGLSYFIRPGHANIKFGLEQSKSEHAFTTSAGSADELLTFTVGVFLSI